jgi:Predicted glycosyltransferases
MRDAVTAVVVLNYNGGDMVLDCIRSLQDAATERTKIICVDNASTDGSFQALQKVFPDINFLENQKNYYFCKGVNVGIANALDMGAEFILVLNNDVFLKPGSIHSMECFMRLHCEVGGCQPLLLYRANPALIQSAGAMLTITGRGWDLHAGTHKNKVSLEAKEVFGITGAAMFLRSEVLREIGLFNEKYLMYLEDVDLSCRIRKSGFKLFLVPEAQGEHIMQASSGHFAESRRAYQCERNGFFLMAEHFSIMQLAIGLPLKVFSAFCSVALNAIKGKMQLSKSMWRATGNGLLYLCGENRMKVQSLPEGKNMETRIAKKIFP